MFNKVTKGVMIAALSLGALAGATTAAIAANGTNPNAMTWGTHGFKASNGATPAQVTAWAQVKASNPKATVVGCKGSCDSYQGDTAETEKLRILCFVPGSIPEPTGYAGLFSGGNYSNSASPNWQFYYGWSGGKIGLSIPVLGSTITSRAVGDGICKHKTKGLNDANARMAEHHDNGVGGWSMGGEVHANSKVPNLLLNASQAKSFRFWTAINGQPANLWD